MPTANPRQVDPNTFIPPAVRAAAEAADRRLESMVAPPPDPQLQPSPPQSEPQPQPQPEPAPPAPQPQPQPQPEPAPPAPQPQDDPRTREQAIQDHRAEVGKNRTLRTRVHELEEEVSNLRTVLASMHAVAPAQPATTAMPDELKFEDFSEAEINELGPDFVAAAKRAAGLIVAPHLKALQVKTAELDARLGQTTQSITGNAHEQMRSYLNGKVPDWMTINRSPAFEAWVDELDDFSGQTRKAMLMDAWNKNDGPRVAVFFRRFLEATGAPQRASDPAPGTPAPTPASAKPSLETFAAPGTARPSGGNSTTPAAQVPIRRTDIARFYAERNAGRWKGREAEAAAFEQRIIEAGKTGQII